MPGSRTAVREGAADGEPAARFLRRPEVRDVLAWLRLLVDPQDASAVVRALGRPPVDLRQVDLARVIQVARRRRADLVLGLGAATESPQVPPEARERIQRFVELHRRASVDMETLAPDHFVARLIDALGERGRPLLAPEQAAEQRASLDGLLDLARQFVGERPGASGRELARHLVLAAPEPRATKGAPAPTPGADAGAAPAASPEQPQGEPGTSESSAADAAAGEPEQDVEAVSESSALEELLAALRDEVLDDVGRIGGRLVELRLDTDLDISHGIVRYLELLKLSALLQRPDGEPLEDALADINLRLLAAATPLQREILQTSTLDRALLGSDAGSEGAPSLGSAGERSLGTFLPRRGAGLALSASDIETYVSCPLRYKFARVLRIPTEPTRSQRFGIAVHQVLERYHSEGSTTVERLLELLEAGMRRAGLGDDEQSRALRAKARASLRRYHERLNEHGTQPVWFERSFSFRLGPHHLRGRVDRVDRVDGEEEAYELIDYKTSRPKTAEQLRDDVQLSLYALAAREDWQLATPRQAYYYVLDDVKVPVTRDEADTRSVADVVLQVGEGILAQAFEPTPSPSACRLCDYRIVCPAAER